MDLRLLYQAREAAFETLERTERAIDRATPEDDLDALRNRFDEAAAEFDRVCTNLADAERRQGLRDNSPLPEPARPGGNFQVARGSLRSELTYRPDQPGQSFFRDAWLMRERQDFAAQERLERNSREQRDVIVDRYGADQFRDVGSSAFSGLVVPQYLVDLVAPLARSGSPLLNALVSRVQLPVEGLTVNVSRITTGSTVAAQAAENTAVSETDMDDTLLTVNVRTYAGQQDVSRQSLERGAGIDQVVYNDLARAYMSTVDSAIINADGTAGTHLGIRSTAGIISVAYTDASPTIPELYPKVADAVQQVESGLYRAPSIILMHPRRWRWLTAGVDSQNRPYVVPNQNGPFNALAVADAPAYGQVVGLFHGLPVITDANIPTNLGGGTEDVILVLATPDLVFWQEADGMPRQLRFEQVQAPQSIRLAVWGYSAFTAGRYPLANATIGGTGLVAPTF